LKLKKINSHVNRSVVKGDQPQRVKILYEGHSQNSIGFSFSNPGYHSRQKASGLLLVQYTWFDITGIKIDGINNADHLLERYAGYRAGYWIGNKRIQGNLEYSSFRAQWSPGTLAAANANPAGADLYRLRDTIAPSVKFTITPDFHFTYGVVSSLLQMQSPVLHFETVRTGTVNLDYSFPSSTSGNYVFSSSYELHTGAVTHGGADYSRHVWDESVGFWKQKEPRPGLEVFLPPHRINVSLTMGRINGSAPMFERFSQGSIDTLRGWNKYDISPLGGSREVYASVDYIHKYGRVFYDSGAVWNSGQAKVLRKSIGGNISLGTLLRAPLPLRWILNIASPGIGIPIRSGRVHPMFTIGSGS
jgi:hypothetical protein